MDTGEIYRLLERRRRELGLSQAEVGLRVADKLDSTPLQNIRRGSSPSVDRLEAFARALDLEFYFGPRRGGAPTLRGFAETATNLTTAAIDGSPEALRLGFLPIPFNDRANGYRGSAPVAVARAWLDERGLAPEGLSWIIAPDAGMAPLVPAGALCLIEKTFTQPDRPGVSAFWSAGRIVLTHASRPNGTDWMFDFLAPDAPARYIGHRDAPALYLLGRVAAVFAEHPMPQGD